MWTVQVFAGTDLALFDLVRSIPLRKIVPNGEIIIEPAKSVGRYDDRHIAALLKKLNIALSARKEDEPVAVQLLYVDHSDGSTRAMLKSFFPFALTRALSEKTIRTAHKASVKAEREEAVAGIVNVCAQLRATASVVRGYTHIANMSPLLLPLKNFAQPYLDQLVEKLFTELGKSEDPKALLDQELAAFEGRKFLVKSPGSEKKCFSNGVLYFNSPGRDRHGFFRNASVGHHAPWCLPSARSRFGGSFDYRFHFDVTSANGHIRGKFPDCHGDEVMASKHTHVNIAPNDFVI